MARNDTTSALIDGLMKCVVFTGTLSIGLIAPKLIQELDGPALAFFKKMDERSRERELRRILAYMLREQLITEHYQHGIIMTKKGQKRMAQKQLSQIEIVKPDRWDKNWRLVMFDIPEKQHVARVKFTAFLRTLGFQPLQQSIWVHPFPCRDEIALIAKSCEIEKFVTYIETSHIDHDELLVRRFRHILH